MKDRMMKAGMGQIVTRTTHHREDGDSIIDLIFTNISMKVSAVKHTTMGGDHDLLEITRRSKYIRKKATIQKRSWKEFTEERMREEAKKQKWDMFDKVRTEEELDEATRKFHEAINKVADVVAPWKTIKLNPNYLGRWMTDELQQEI